MARSNRTLTQFVVDRIRYALVYGPETVGRSVAGNTEVESDVCSNCARPAHLVVRLFGKEIIRLFFSPLNKGQVLGILVSTGDFYDSKGRPSRTTRERLNGILDALGTAKFIPENVRVFINTADNQCYIGRGDAAKVFNSSQPKVIIMANSKELLFS